MLRVASISRDAKPSGQHPSTPFLLLLLLLSIREESEDVRLLHLVMNWRPSLTNSRGISRNSFAWSIVRDVLCVICWRDVEWFGARSGEVEWSVGVNLVCGVGGGGRSEVWQQWWSDRRRGACRTLRDSWLLGSASHGDKGSGIEVQTTFFTRRILRRLIA